MQAGIDWESQGCRTTGTMQVKVKRQCQTSRHLKDFLTDQLLKNIPRAAQAGQRDITATADTRTLTWETLAAFLSVSTESSYKTCSTSEP